MEELKIIDVTPENFNDYEQFIPNSSIEMMNEGMAQTYIALENDEVVGALTVFFDEETGLLDIYNIYIVEEKRRKNYGFNMLENVAGMINEQTDYSIRGMIASFSESNEDAMNFFDALGFDLYVDEDSAEFVYTLDSMKNSYLMENKYTVPSEYDLIRYSELDNIKKKKLISVVEEHNGVYDMSFAADLDEELSISVWEDDEPVGTVEIICDPDGSLALGQFFVVKMDTVILAVLQIIVQKLIEKFPGDTKFKAYIISESSRRLITKLLGEDCEKINLIDAELSFVDNHEMEEDFWSE